MSEFREGQRVKVEFEGEIERCGGGMEAAVKIKNPPYGDRLYLTGLENVKITVLAPPFWPPQVGDIWEAEGVEWFAGHSKVLDEDIVLTHAETRHWLGVGAFRLRNPVLVRRRHFCTGHDECKAAAKAAELAVTG